MLDRLDETLETAMHRDPSLLLIQPANAVLPSSPGVESDAVETKPSSSSPLPAAATVGGVNAAGGGKESGSGAAGHREAVAVKKRTAGVENNDTSGGETEELVLSCLKFLAILMRNCVNKHIFSSSEV